MTILVMYLNRRDADGAGQNHSLCSFRNPSSSLHKLTLGWFDMDTRVGGAWFRHVR